MKRILLLCLLISFYGAKAQITLDYTTQTGAFNATHTTNTGGSYFAGAYNNSGTEIGTYANGSGGGYTGDPGVALFRTFTTNASANAGTARPMQVGDEFSITCYVNNSSSFFNNSNAGISFNGGTSSSAFSNYNTLQRARFQINKDGNWFAAAGITGNGYAVPNQDVVFKLKLTSAKTANLTITSPNGAVTYDVVLANSLGASANIQNFVIWNRTSGGGNDMYWKNASLKSTGTVEIGNGNGTSVFDGVISDGLLPVSTSIVNVNDVIKSGTGTITFSAANTYTGATRINGGIIRLSGVGTLGIGSEVYISSGATLDLNSVNATVASVQETGTSNGGVVTLGTATLTLSGGWTGTKYQNSISGSGGITKQGSGTLALYGTQGYTGTTTVSGGEISTAVAMASTSYVVNGGTLRLGAANIIPDAASVTVSSGTLAAEFNETINNLTLSGGTLSVSAGRTLTINGALTVNGLHQIALGSGASIVFGSGGSLVYNLSGPFSMTATEWPATAGPSSVTVQAGTLNLTANRTVSGNLTVSGGTLDLSTFSLSRATAGGTLTLSGTGSLSIGGTGTLPANFTAHAISGTSTITYNGGNQAVAILNSSQSYGNLTISGTGTKTLQGNAGVAGNLAVNAATLNLAEHTLNGAGGTLTIANGAALQVGGTNTLPAGYGSYTFGATSTVEYNGGIQQVSQAGGSSYGHLNLSGSGSKTLAGSVTTAGNLTVTSVAFTVASGLNLTVNGNVINSAGTITLQNNANLLQDTAATTNNNSGSISVFRNSSPLYRQDYTLWSSPVAGQNLFGFSPVTLANRFYTYNTTDDEYNVIPGLGASSLTVFNPGAGYLIRMPNGGVDGDGNPTGTTSSPANYQLGTATMIFNGKFTGVPNNGTVTVSLDATGNGYNLVGNPYPSPISISALRAANTDAINGALWIWRKKNGSANSGYVTINSVGIYTGNDEPEQENPDGILRTGQGFFVQVKETPTQSNIVFTNAMRSTDTADQFFRNANIVQTPQDIENHGVWLNLTNDAGVFSQMYTGYIAGATALADEGIDARYINDSPVVLASLIDNQEYVIQGRSLPFTAQDVVPLQLRVTAAGSYTIAIDHVNGLFAEGQEVYLKDNQAGTLHNLSTPYTFTTDAGTFGTRFEVVFTNQALSVAGQGAGAAAVNLYRDDNVLAITAANTLINEVEVHDLRGRLLHTERNVNSAAVRINTLAPQQQVLLVKVMTDKGIVNKKIVY